MVTTRKLARKRECYWAATGIVLMLLGLTAFVTIHPLIVSIITHYKLFVLAPNSFTFPLWQKIPVPIYSHFYLFNVTNPEEILNQEKRPLLAELGPYVYQESREKVNITWFANGTVRYYQRRVWHFVPEMSNGSRDDLIVHLNYPLMLSFAIIAAKKNNDFYYMSLCQFGSSVFLKHSVQQLLFDGFHDDDVARLSRMFQIPNVAFFGSRNNSLADGVYDIFTGEGGLDQMGLLDKWNDDAELKYYEKGSECSRLSTATPGEVFEPFQDRAPSMLNLFIGDFCRSLPLSYDGPDKHGELAVSRYTSDETFLNYNYEFNRCYCRKPNCTDPFNRFASVQQDGIFYIGTCFNDDLDLPMAISLPHLLYAGQYAQDVEGLTPDATNHRLLVDFEPTLGVPIHMKAGVQLNVPFMKDLVFESYLKDPVYSCNKTYGNFTFNVNKYPFVLYPQFWFQENADVRDDSATLGLVRLWQKWKPIAILAVSGGLIFLGLLIVVGVVLASWKRRKQVSFRFSKRSTVYNLTTQTVF